MSRSSRTAPHITSVLRFIMMLSALAVTGCDGDAGPALVVSVSDIPSRTDALQLVAHLDQQVAAQALRFPLNELAEQRTATFGLRLPVEAAERQLALAVAAIDVRGCIIAVGSQLDDTLRVQAGGNGEQLARVVLSTVETDCQDNDLRLLRVTPPRVSTQGKNSAGQLQPVQLLGWGFVRGGEVQIGGQRLSPDDIEWRSFAELRIKKLPPQSRIGNAIIKVRGVLGSSAQRQDLLAFFAATIDFDAARDLLGSPLSFGLHEAGDWNGDGALDLVFTYSEAVISLLGDGTGHFRKAVSDQDTALRYAYGLSAADLNGDRRSDLVAEHAGTGNDLCVLFATAEGRFQPCVLAGEKQSYNRLLVADFNGDERLDLAVANTSKVDILYRKPSQTAPLFTTVKLYDAAAQSELSVADLDGNGRSDLVAYPRGTKKLYTFMASASQPMSPPRVETDFSPAYEPNRLTLFDSGQGFELLLGHRDGITRLISDGAGRFSAAPELALPGDQVIWIGTAPINRDDSIDLWIRADRGSSSRVFKPLLIDRSGILIPAPEVPLGKWQLPLLGRFDQDESVDLVLDDEDRARLALGRGDGSFRLAPAIPVGPSPCCLVLGDVDGDGALDVIVARQGNIEILANDGHGRFVTPPIPLLTTERTITALAAPDLNGDARPDVVIASQRALFLFLSRGAKGVEAISRYELEHEIKVWDFADVNGDAQLDIVVAGGGRVSLLFGDGQGTLRGMATHPGLDDPLRIAAADLNRDGQPELVLLNETTLTVMRSMQPGRYVAEPPYLPFKTCRGLALADFDADGFLDAAIAEQAGANTFVSMMRGTASGRFLIARDVFIGDVPGPLHVADFNGDGSPDLLSATRGVSQVLVNSGLGTFLTAASVGEGGAAGNIALGDLNGDTLPDFVSLSKDSVHVVLNRSQ